MKVRKGDTVLIISGKYRGKTGKVLRAFPTEKQILVEGVNLVKRHQRPKRPRQKGQIIEFPKPIDISNAKLVCPKCGKATRIGYKVTESRKYRICKECRQEI